jgi:subtilisin family serine protease
MSNIESVPSINKEIFEAINKQIVVCVPAGNGNGTMNAGTNDEDNSIEETGSILVGAAKFLSGKNKPSATNRGNRVVVYAPGDPNHDLTCGVSNDGYEDFGGTSGATAKVAGVVALMLEKNNQLTPQEVREILGHSQKPVVDQHNEKIGVLLDADQAVREAIAYTHR